MSSFAKIFPRVTLAIFGLMLPILLGASAVVFSVEFDRSALSTDSPLPAAVLGHPKVFAVSCVGYCLMAVAASLGMIRKRKWAHSAWVVLLLVGLLWTAVNLFSATSTLLIGEAKPSGRLPAFDVLAALGIIGPGLGMFVLGAYLLRRLLSPEVKGEFFPH